MTQHCASQTPECSVLLEDLLVFLNPDSEKKIFIYIVDELIVITDTIYNLYFIKVLNNYQQISERKLSFSDDRYGQNQTRDHLVTRTRLRFLKTIYLCIYLGSKYLKFYQIKKNVLHISFCNSLDKFVRKVIKNIHILFLGVEGGQPNFCCMVPRNIF